MRALRRILRQEELEAEMDAEMRHHVELEAAELVRGGMSPNEAHRQAMLAFGGVQQKKEDALEQGPFVALELFRRDVRIATRTLLRNRTFTVTATLALALAIGVNTTLFSVIDAMMNPSGGATNSEQLYELKYFGDPRKRVDFTQRETAFRASVGLHQSYTEYAYSGAAVERRVRAEDARVLKVRANFFSTLGVKPLSGRLAPGGAVVSGNEPIVISSRLQSLLFARGESVIGASILLEGRPHIIVGVTERFDALDPLRWDVWIFAPDHERLGAKIIRLKDGTTREDTERRLQQLAAQIALTAGDDTKDSRFQLLPIQRPFQVRQFHYALIGAGLAILIVACTNLANLQLARGLTRAGELAVRSAVGATRRQIVSQMLIESGVLAVFALIVALGLTLAGNTILAASVPPSVGEYVVKPQTSWRMVLFAAIAAVASLLAIGVLPALRASRIDINALLKGRTGTGQHRTNRRIYGALVIVQIALTLPLTCAAVLLSRSAALLSDTQYLIENTYGFDPRPLVVIGVQLPKDSTGRWISLGATAADLVARVKAAPGVLHAAASWGRDVRNDAVSVDDVDGGVRQIEAPMGAYSMVTAEYFRTFDFPITKGEGFESGTYGEGAVIIDETTAARFWPNAQPVGRLVKFADRHSADSSMRVTGVMTDRLGEEARETRRIMNQSRFGRAFRLMTGSDSIRLGPYARSITIHARVSGDPAPVVEGIRRSLSGSSNVAPMVRLFSEFSGMARQRIVTQFVAALFTVFGVIALGLSALGVYAIVAQSVTDRQREVAVRVALGASPRSIVHALIREGNVVVLAGVAIGLYMTKETVSWIELFLGGVDIYSAPFFGGMCVALFMAMATAALVPAIRATRLDPMEVLRAE